MAVKTIQTIQLKNESVKIFQFETACQKPAILNKEINITNSENNSPLPSSDKNFSFLFKDL